MDILCAKSCSSVPETAMHKPSECEAPQKDTPGHNNMWPMILGAMLELYHWLQGVSV